MIEFMFNLAILVNMAIQTAPQHIKIEKEKELQKFQDLKALNGLEKNMKNAIN